MRRGTAKRSNVAIAATASGGDTIAPSTNAAGPAESRHEPLRDERDGDGAEHDEPDRVAENRPQVRAEQRPVGRPAAAEQQRRQDREEDPVGRDRDRRQARGRTPAPCRRARTRSDTAARSASRRSRTRRPPRGPGRAAPARSSLDRSAGRLAASRRRVESGRGYAKRASGYAERASDVGGLPGQIDDTIESIAELERKALAGASLQQRAIERFTLAVGRPRTVWIILAVVAVWVAINVRARRHRPAAARSRAVLLARRRARARGAADDDPDPDHREPHERDRRAALAAAPADQHARGAQSGQDHPAARGAAVRSAQRGEPRGPGGRRR